MHPKEASRNDHDQDQRDANKARLLANEDETPEGQHNYCELCHVREKEKMLSLHHGVGCHNLSRAMHGADIQTNGRSKHDDRDEPKDCSTDDDLC